MTQWACSRTVGRGAVGMDDRIEVYGEGGLTYANLHMGNALPTYSEYGYGYAVEKAPDTQGLDLSGVRGVVELRFSPGTAAFRALCARQGTTAGHRRGRPAGAGGPIRRLPISAHRPPCTLPFHPTGVKRPIDLWLGEG